MITGTPGGGRSTESTGSSLAKIKGFCGTGIPFERKYATQPHSVNVTVGTGSSHTASITTTGDLAINTLGKRSDKGGGSTDMIDGAKPLIHLFQHQLRIFL